MSAAPRQVFIVSHTHWDREWYRTAPEFRVLLEGVVGEALERLERGGEFRHFLLDGQAIVLEDHLAVHPEDAPRLRRLTASGALAVGPWYVLPDEFLVSGEALVRNLLVGHALAGAIGPVQKVGYAPDAFGHVAQMPQILRRAGIDSFVYTRGDSDDLAGLGLAYDWAAPDGSEVLAIHQWGGYCNAGGLGHEEIWHAHTRRKVDPSLAVRQVAERLAQMSRFGAEIVLLNNGCDHFPPQRDFERILEALRGAFPRTRFVHGSLADFIAALRASAPVSAPARARRAGELRGGRYHPILSGVWSARMPLKQRNDEAQQRLAGLLEPVCAYMRFARGRPYPAGLIREAWKLLLRNHPHDSICGCSIDEVHRQMGPRFSGAIDAATQMLRRELDALAPSFAERAEDEGDIALAVVNPLPWERSEIVERLIVLTPGNPATEELRLYDARGGRVDYEVIDCRTVERFWGIDYRAELEGRVQRETFSLYRRCFGPRLLRPAEEWERSDRYLTIRFPAESVPALGHRRYRLAAAPAGEAPARRAAEAGVRVRRSGCVENDLCRLTLRPDGTLDLIDLESGNEFPGLNLLEDCADIGDEYDFGACPGDAAVTAAGRPGLVRVADAGRLRASLEAEFALELPAALAPDRSRRGAERVDCPVRVRATLSAGSPLVEIDLRFENRACDHRLRALFPAGVGGDEIWTDGHFLVQARPVARPAGGDWVQPPAETDPQQEFALVREPGRGLALLVRGLPEVAPLLGTGAGAGADRPAVPGPPEAREEAVARASRSRPGKAIGAGGLGLAVTLLRCVGWLSRDDFAERRRMNAGPTLPTPEAQCLGPQSFRYALLAFAGDWRAAGVKAWSARYRTPLLTKQGVLDPDVPPEGGLLELRPGEACVSAIKRHEERDTLVVRLYNPGGEELVEELRLGRRMRSAWRVNLLEEREEALPMAEVGALVLRLGPHEILTLEIEFA
ncbi:MAG: hypothetical protein FJY75_00600 [Candidatus Eisenbacteria bacterium]|uniref:Glycoside hydrolase family 38 central domain-containing protein n=1 Tax=Eiseniibacteriota bacterium TaxID=2212470 RepID=A0A937X8X9_UNCEI|nr:hypothetical protein [Candidatus Eisenbacteria bacterium]